MRRAGTTKDEVAKKSKHGTAHVLEMFEAQEPTPSLRLYLDVLGTAGGRLTGVGSNSTKAAIDRLAEIRDQRGLKNADLSRLTGVPRPTISTLFNDPDPNPGLVMFDKIVEALDAYKELGIVSADDPRATFRTFVGGAGSVTTEAPASPPRSSPGLHVVDHPVAPMNVDERRRAEDAEARERAAERRAQVSYDREQDSNTRCTELQGQRDALHEKNLNLERKSLEDEYELRELRTERRWDLAKKAIAGAACFLAGGLVTAFVMHNNDGSDGEGGSGGKKRR